MRKTTTSAVRCAAALAVLVSITATAPAISQTCALVGKCGDVDSSGIVAATDALKVLKKAVGGTEVLLCQCTQSGSECADDLATCNSSLGTCSSGLTTCTSGLGTCNSGLTTCNSGLSTCSSSLTTCNSGLSTCNSNLTSCNSDFDECDSLKQGFQQNLALCNNALEQAEADLIECEEAGVCGDGQIDAIEDCDIGQLGGETCVSQGFAGGTLACATGCAFDTSDCYSQRFDASGPTIIDHKTGLEWEKKDNANGVQNLTNPHDADNLYTWAQFTTVPNGTVFSDFLVRLNVPTGPGTGGTSTPTATGCYANHCDWRLPTFEEALTIVVGSPPCPGGQCLAAAFLPANILDYWTLSTWTPDLNRAWTVRYSDAASSVPLKTSQAVARAVRG